MYRLLFDPQTSGGLIVLVKPGKAEEVIEALKEKGYRHAGVVGKVMDGDGGKRAGGVEGRVDRQACQIRKQIEIIC